MSAGKIDILAKHLMILASAGSGKTFQLANRVIGLVGAQGCEPEKIVALTFTRKAAGEFADSVLSRLAACALDAGKARELHGQIVGHTFQRAKGGKLRGKIGSNELVKVLGSREVPQAMFAEGAQLHARRKMVAHQFLRGQGKEHLAAPGGGKDARDAIERLAEVIAIPVFRRAGVQCHAHFQFLDALPGGGPERSLGQQGSGEGLQGGIEGHAKSIADRLEDIASLRFKRLAQHLVVGREGHAHGVRVLFPFFGAALDI